MLKMPIYTSKWENLSNGIDMLIMIKFSDRQNQHDPATRAADFLKSKMQLRIAGSGQ